MWPPTVLEPYRHDPGATIAKCGLSFLSKQRAQRGSAATNWCRCRYCLITAIHCCVAPRCSQGAVMQVQLGQSLTAAEYIVPDDEVALAVIRPFRVVYSLALLLALAPSLFRSAETGAPGVIGSSRSRHRTELAHRHRQGKTAEARGTENTRIPSWAYRVLNRAISRFYAESIRALGPLSAWICRAGRPEVKLTPRDKTCVS